MPDRNPKPADDEALVEVPIYWHGFTNDRVMRVVINERMRSFDLLVMRRMLANARTPEHVVSVLSEFVSLDNVGVDVCRFKPLLAPKRAA